MIKTPAEDYVEKAKRLTKEEAERLMSRVRAKLMRRLEDKKISDLEVVAIQLEIEDEALNEWREKMAEIRERHKDQTVGLTG
jgi:predicted O-linked N-acetylglucosamine transferase (SPINDLY family)